MTRILQTFFAVAIIFSVSSVSVFGCTTFCLKNNGEVLFGKNYDWMISDGLVFVNKRGVAKMSADDSEKNRAKWTSKYGSVTFNQYGWESPSGGMNEAGLVIELMWLDDTEWPAKDDRPVIDVLEWIQFNLDTAATVQEVISKSDTVRIASQVKLHYLVNDKAGNAATIEFLNGKLVAHSGKDLEFTALANDTYSRSLSYARQADTATSESSLDRFTRAALKAKEFNKKPKTEQESVDYAFGILADVAQTNTTQWSIVYDQKRAKVHFRTRKAPQTKTVDTRSFDYSCGSPVKLLDMNSAGSGDVTGSFVEYTRAANRDLIERSFKGTDFLSGVPSSVKDHYAEFPETFVCVEKKTKMHTEPKRVHATASAWNFVYLFNPVLWYYRQTIAG